MIKIKIKFGNDDYCPLFEDCLWEPDFDSDDPESNTILTMDIDDIDITIRTALDSAPSIEYWEILK